MHEMRKMYLHKMQLTHNMDHNSTEKKYLEANNQPVMNSLKVTYFQRLLTLLYKIVFILLYYNDIIINWPSNVTSIPIQN